MKRVRLNAKDSNLLQGQKKKKSIMDPIIITVAPNGARKTEKDHPNIPLTPEAIAQDAKNCVVAGAAMIHLHVRDTEGKHTLDVKKYKEVTDAIRAAVGENIIIQVTSEEVGMYTPEDQMKMVMELKPEAVSLAICEFIPDKSYEETARSFFADVVKEGIMPQYIIYSPGEALYFADLRKRGIIPGKKVFVLFVLGKKTLSQDNESVWSTPDDLDVFLETFDQGVKLAETHWAVCSFGGNENACMLKTANCGGHVRIGFENNHLLASGEIAPDNAALIKQFSSAAGEVKRQIADANLARVILSDTLRIKED